MLNKGKECNNFEDLVQIMKLLRSKDGCPWDREQTINSLKPYLIEEAFEVLEVMDEGGDKLKEELGDLLLQVVFQSQIKEEENEFDIYNVISTIIEKLKRRHPHVFGDVCVSSVSDVSKNWEKIKIEEGKIKKSILDGIPKGLPPLIKSFRIQEKASSIGFDWEDKKGALAKFFEEIAELKKEIAENNIEKIENELGDVLFALVNVSRKLNIQPISALEKTNEKFKKRFQYIESKTNINDANLVEMEKLWEKAKDEIG